MRRSSRSRTATLATAALLCSAALAADDGYLLRLDVRPGEEISYRMTIDQDLDLELGPMGRQNVENRIEMDARLVVDDVAGDGNVHFAATYERLAMKVGMAGREAIAIDSADPETGGDGPFAALVGKPIRFVQQPDGEIVRVSGLTEMLDDVVGGAVGDPLAEQLKQSFGDEGLTKMMQQLFPVFPSDRRRPGDTWSQRLDLSNPVLGDLWVDYAYELVGEEPCGVRRCVRLDVAVDMEMNGESPMIEQIRQMSAAQGAEIDLHWDLGRSTGQGSMWIDRASGVVHGVDLTHTMDMTVSISATADGQPQDLTMHVVLDQTMRMERVE